MANIFTLVMVIATLVTGILWCLYHCDFLQMKIKDVSQQITIKAEEQTSSLESITVIKKESWIQTCSSLFPVLLFVLVVRSFVYEPFQIPSSSMMPTMLVGDFILVDKFSYGLKNPLTQTTLIQNGHPKRGDVVVFKYPPNPGIYYIKRVVGLPGDHVSYDPMEKKLKVQLGCNSNHYCDTTLPITYIDIRPSDFIQTFNVLDNSKISSNFIPVTLNKNTDGGTRLFQCKEYLGNIGHNILTTPGHYDQLDMYYHQQNSDLLTEWSIPQDTYFMMGDNRDNSFDSRYWGFVPEQNIVGKAIAIWISFEKKEGEWPTGIRFSRISFIQ